MPKIPIPDIPRLPEHQDNATHFNSAPGLNWNVNPDDPGRALQHFGNRVLAMGLKAGDYLKEFAEERQKAEDTDAFQELELLTIQSNNDMNAFMRDNPGRYEDFSREYQTRFEALEDQRTEIKNRMSTQGKKAADFYIQKDRLNQTETVSRIERQAFVTAKTQNLESRLTRFAKMGQPPEDVQRMIDDYTVGDHPILTPEMGDAYMQKYLEQYEFFQVRDLIENGGSSEVWSALEEKDGNGKFTKYTNLSQSDRRKLTQFCEQKQTEEQNAEDDSILNDILTGNWYQTEAEFDDALENGDIFYSNERENRIRQWVRTYERQQKTEQEAAEQEQQNNIYAAAVSSFLQGDFPYTKTDLDSMLKQKQITNETYNRLVPLLEKDEAQKRSARIDAVKESFIRGNPVYKSFDDLDKALKKGLIDRDEFDQYLPWVRDWNSAERQRVESFKRERDQQIAQMQAQQKKDRLQAFLLQVDLAEFSSDPLLANQKEQTLRGLAVSLFESDLDSLSKAVDAISSRKKEFVNLQGVFQQPEGKLVMSYILKEYRKSDGTYKGLKWDPNGWKKDKSQEFMQARYYEVIDYARELLGKGKTANEVIKIIEDNVAKLNDGQISTIFDTSRFLLNPGDIWGGYRFKGGDPSDKNNWDAVRK